MPLFRKSSGGGRPTKFITVADTAARLALTPLIAKNGDHVKEIGSQESFTFLVEGQPPQSAVFLIDEGGVGGDWYFYFSIDGGGVDPGVGAQGYVVDILGTDTASEIATKIKAVLDGIGQWTVVRSGARLTVTDTDYVERVDASDVDTGWTFSTLQSGATPSNQLFELINEVDIDSESGWLLLVPGKVAEKYRFKPDGTFQFWNSDQNEWFELKISGGVSEEFTEIVTPGES